MITQEQVLDQQVSRLSSGMTVLRDTVSTDQERHIRFAGIVPVEINGKNVRIWLMRPEARKPHLPPPEFQIGKGTRMRRGAEQGGWHDLTETDMPLSDDSTIQAESLLRTAVREGEEELGVLPTNIERLWDVGVFSFTSASTGAAKQMWLYVAALHDVNLLQRPDKQYGHTQECHWLDLSTDLVLIRPDHADVLQDIAARYNHCVINNEMG